jgi:hypothetical protein
MSYLQKLEDWYATERAAGRVVDIKLFPGGSTVSVEQQAKAIYETVTGVRATRPVDTRDL